jgi:hypothetical protein
MPCIHCFKNFILTNSKKVLYHRPWKNCSVVHLPVLMHTLSLGIAGRIPEDIPSIKKEGSTVAQKDVKDISVHQTNR